MHIDSAKKLISTMEPLQDDFHLYVDGKLVHVGTVAHALTYLTLAQFRPGASISLQVQEELEDLVDVEQDLAQLQDFRPWCRTHHVPMLRVS
jgi:hypothetical protein